MGKGGRVKTTPYRGPLGRWGAFFNNRGQNILQVEALGPRVEASTPEEAIEKTIEALIEKAGDVPN